MPADEKDRTPIHGIRRLGDLLPQLMARRGYNRLQAQQELFEVWERVSGEWSRDTRAGTIRRGVLEVVVRNSLVLQELSFQKPSILQQIRNEAPQWKVHDLRFVVGSID